MDPELLWVFIPTIAAISLTPGMCMTLAFSLGLSQGYRQTLWMMWGELAGVATVVISCVLLLAWIQSLSAIYFTALALIGGSYLLWTAYRLWTQPVLFTGNENRPHLSAGALLILGYVTAVMNPKGWAFMLALLPGFINTQSAIAPQLSILLAVMLCTEFLSLSLYASGGKWVGGLLKNDANLKLLNRFAALLMILVAVLVFV